MDSNVSNIALFEGQETLLNVSSNVKTKTFLTKVIVFYHTFSKTIHEAFETKLDNHCQRCSAAVAKQGTETKMKS